MRGGLRAATLTLLLLTLAPLQAQSPAAQSAAESERQLERLQGEIKHLRSDLSIDRQNHEVLLAELREREQAIGETARRLREIDVALQQQQQRLDNLEVEQAGHHERLDEQRRVLVRQLRSAYAMGRQQRLKILLNQEDPSVVSRLMVYYDYLNRARIDEMARLDELLVAIERGRAQIAQEQQRLRALQASAAAQRLRLEESREQRRQVAEALERTLQDKNRRLDSLVRDREQLQALLEQLRKQIFSMPLAGAEQRPFNALKGKLRWPLKGRLGAAFGSVRAGGMKLEGVIIDAAQGTEIHAIHRGRVAFADWLRGFGLLLIVDHGDGYMTLYGHNQSLFKETGEWVEAGEVIALVGNSGGRSKSGVYFGIRINGKPANPRHWCRRPRGRQLSAALGSRGGGQVATVHHSVALAA